MKWRNEQIDILRQKELLSKEKQNNYFNSVVSKLFEQDQPSQILFSFMRNNVCIGYGGLVHINWIDRNAEISFILDTELSSEKSYLVLFNIFLDLIESVAKDVKIHKIFTYGYVFENYRFTPLIDNNFLLEAILKDHIIINNEFKDVKIYAKILQNQ
jgi:RimJ/RimL family protein N-acetyltransferase